MKPCTVSCGPLTISWDGNGTLTIARTDYVGSVQMSQSEFVFFLKCCELVGWPHAAPTLPRHDT